METTVFMFIFFYEANLHAEAILAILIILLRTLLHMHCIIWNVENKSRKVTVPIKIDKLDDSRIFG